ncbi:MAG: M42 family metallopeptidase [Defluviitaleaceae bacterium]|nr:M42 family metallopeptidase [Defluviitaleaceae bacterium]
MKAEFNKDYTLKVLQDILAVDSPSGFTKNVVEKLVGYVKEIGFPYEITNKGNLIVSIFGESDKTVGLAAHVDTLGLIVRGLKSDGTLSFMKIGGAILGTLDGEYCNIYTRCGKCYTGTILSNSPAGHVFMDAHTIARDEDTMHIRLDEKVKSKEDVLKLGINSGDFICYEPKTQITESGFIKSRFLDDKLSVAILIGAMKYIKDAGVKIKHNLKVIFPCYEEVGHGMSYMPDDISEIIAVDMGCIGLDLNCTEYDVSICAKDTSGPYDYELVTRLAGLAKDNGLNYAVDIYPRYGSDVSAALRAGYDIKGCVIGPGVAASHGMERTHIESVENTFKLILLYLTA